MIEKNVDPMIYVADVWPRAKFQKPIMDAYKELEKANGIWIRKVIYNKQTEMVVIEYESNVPEQWTHDLLKKLVRQQPSFEQTSMPEVQNE